MMSYLYDKKLTHGTDHCICPACRLYFNSTAAFDKHRVGVYQPDERRCFSITQMREIGMEVNAKGYWGTELKSEDFHKK